MKCKAVERLSHRSCDRAATFEVWDGEVEPPVDEPGLALCDLHEKEWRARALLQHTKQAHPWTLDS